jgi:hypothetical protein
MAVAITYLLVIVRDLFHGGQEWRCDVQTL